MNFISSMASHRKAPRWFSIVMENFAHINSTPWPTGPVASMHHHRLRVAVRVTLLPVVGRRWCTTDSKVTLKKLERSFERRAPWLMGKTSLMRISFVSFTVWSVLVGVKLRAWSFYTTRMSVSSLLVPMCSIFTIYSMDYMREAGIWMACRLHRGTWMVRTATDC